MFSFLPVLPGSLIVWLGMLIHWLWVPSESVSQWFLVFSFVAVIATLILDFLCSMWGAKLFGASWRGGVGALIGGVLGPILMSFVPGVGTLFGLLVGPIIGAVIGELWAGSTFRKSSKAGVGTIVGGVIAFIVKFGITMGMIVSFFVFKASA